MCNVLKSVFDPSPPCLFRKVHETKLVDADSAADKKLRLAVAENDGLLLPLAAAPVPAQDVLEKQDRLSEPELVA